MAGTPKKRARRELESALDAVQANADNAEPESYPQAKRGASAEWMREITKKRMEMAAADPSKKGGRPRTNYSRAQAEEMAIEAMLPKALLVLKRQLDSPDERVSQAAAVKVLEYVKGKPTQKVETEQKITAIRYESAAWTFGQDEIEDGEIVEPPALEAGDGG